MRISDWSSDVCSSDLENTAEPRSAAAGESVEIDAGGHHFDGHQHAAFTKGRGDAGAWSEDAITEIGVAGRESDDEATKNPGIARNIMGVLLVHRMVGEDERSEEHTSELQSLMRISYAVFCLKKKKTKI